MRNLEDVRADTKMKVPFYIITFETNQDLLSNQAARLMSAPLTCAPTTPLAPIVNVANRKRMVRICKSTSFVETHDNVLETTLTMGSEGSKKWFPASWVPWEGLGKSLPVAASKF